MWLATEISYANASVRYFSSVKMTMLSNVSRCVARNRRATATVSEEGKAERQPDLASIVVVHGESGAERLPEFVGGSRHVIAAAVIGRQRKPTSRKSN
jgi:hypothetical protein